MASVADQIMIKMGLDASSLQQGLARSKQEIGATGQAIDKMGAKWKATASMLTRTVIAPIAGFMSLGAVIKSYFGGVAQVAQLTGAYSQKMEEWRKKRAMLARYNREDIELYKKGREAVVKFQITMDDLSAKIMRSVSPAIKWLIDKLNGLSNWIDRNQNNIIRFFSVVAGVITAILIPAFLKLAVAMLTNPLTWIIGLIGLLILVIDDLVTYLRGGDALFGAFWGPLVEWCKIAWEWITKFFKAFSQSEGVKAIIAITLNWNTHLANGLKQLWDLTVRWFNLWNEKTNNFKGIVEAFKGVFQTIWGLFETLEAVSAGVFGAIVALFTGDTTMLKNAWKLLCDGLENTFKGAFKIIEGVIIHVKGVFDVLKEVINKIVDAVMNFGSALKNALNIDGLIEKVKNGLSNILPDWVKSTLGINTENGSDGQPTIYAGTDAPIVPDVESMQAIKAQSKGNVNNNISRSQVINVGSNNPAVVTATMREADREMNDADRWIAMASQGSVY